MGTTKTDIVEAVYAKQIGFTKKEASELVDAVLDVMKEAIGNGETVKVSGFGKFVVKQKSERVGRNPKTGEAITVSQRRVLTFSPSPILKAAINGKGK